MGKNLKRQNVVLGTPGGASRQSGQPPLSIGGKRQKQMSLFPFLRTPAHAEETPALQFKTGNAGISSTGLHKLGQLQLQTQQKQPSNGLNVAPTQVRPAVPEPQCQDASPGSDDDFVISMSQTYERTQPEPCWDFGSAEHEEVELSLRRTQQYQAAASTQHYNYHHHHNHHHELLVAAVATTLDNTDSAAAAISTADAVEASVAHASAVGHGTAVASAATILLPPEVLLEGQGSNQPGNVAVFLAAASREQSRMGPRPAVNIDFHGHFQTSALPAVSSGPAQTPELQIGGICVGGIGGGGAAGNGGIGGSACTTVAEDMVDDGTTPPLQVGLPLFPIFAQGGERRARRRAIHLIRHGESEYNLACRRRGGFGDPGDIFDACLTPTGEKQAKALRPQLLDLMQQHGDPLFIVSPLSRAIQTFLLMLPDPERLRICSQTPPPPARQALSQLQQPSRPHPPPQLQQGTGQGTGSSCVSSGLTSKPIDVVICPFLTEFLHTSGDVGRPRSVLIESYPQLAVPLRKGLDKERWWYENASKGPNCAISKTLSSIEPDKTAKARVESFRRFVFSQSHRPMVVVGHANFFRTLTQDSHYMGNCQMVTWAP
ncbi:hypothetical protein PLESTF_001072200 [Pleodorina starrii]|nr:hypothetical protein PLESTM_001147500 [Pleodorina starrii]GLC71077.1 hypothetical protein PLESTF_001072200 [Pleodorina starrii]